MSYDIYLNHPVTGEVLELEEPHHMRGGTYCVGGEKRLHLNVTYNYGKHYYRVFGENGIRTIYGLTGAQSLPLLDKAIEALGTDMDDDYWRATEGNARMALIQLKALAQLRPDGVWDGD